VRQFPQLQADTRAHLRPDASTRRVSDPTGSPSRSWNSFGGSCFARVTVFASDSAGDIMSERSLEQIVSTGARVSRRELFKALRAAGCEVVATSKPTHFVVRHANGIVIIATRSNDVLPVYVSRIVRSLGMREGGSGG
jgi:hypothetical protein